MRNINKCPRQRRSRVPEHTQFTSSKGVVVSVATSADLAEICQLNSDTLSAELPRCWSPWTGCSPYVCCSQQSCSQWCRGQIAGVQPLRAREPAKISHCGLVRDGAQLVGVCQMQILDDLCDPFIKHTLRPVDAHVEWMACSQKARGRGVGSALLEWAEHTAVANGATMLTLEVVRGNRANGQIHCFSISTASHSHQHSHSLTTRCY